MNAPITIEQLRDIMTACKRQGWEEGRAAAVDLLQADFQCMGAEDKIFLTARAAILFAKPNPYGPVSP